MMKLLKVKVLCLLALVFCAGIILSSCKDNENVSDGPNTSDEEASEQGSEKGEALLSILNYTAGVDSLPDDWYKSNYTVEPTVGTADDTNPYVRYVSATSVESANVTYRSMISADVTDGAVTDDEWSMDGIGTLDFKVLDQPDVIATVDVKVKQLPHLTQIRFVPPSAMGENSNWFSGDPYYNFGDIVQDKEGSYWICVRPADKATKKSKTHWISFNIVKDNFEEYENGDATLVLPDKLGDKAGSEEFIPDFLQFLKAISPGLIVKNDNKEDFIVKGSAEYNDVKISDVKRSVKDLSMIANFWNKYRMTMADGILNNQFFIPIPVKELLLKAINGENLNVFYCGHHAGSTPDVHLLTIDGSNPVNTIKKEIKFEWPTDNGVYSFKSYATDAKSNTDIDKLKIKTKGVTSWPKEAIVVRYKTGPQLSGSKTIWGNDEYPGKSYTEYAKNPINNIYLYKDRKLTNYYTLGDIVNTKKYGDFCCIKPFCSKYLNDNNYAYFLIPGSYQKISGYLIDCEQNSWTTDLSWKDITEDDLKIAMFNLMNAYLLSCGKQFAASYSIGLKTIWNQFILKNDLKNCFEHNSDDRYILKLGFADGSDGSILCTLTYKDGKYRIERMIGEPREDFPAVSLVYYKDEGVGSKYLFNLTEVSKADITISAEEAVAAYTGSGFDTERVVDK